MDFKEWLQANEARLKGFKRIFQQQFPNLPRYVQNDLYNSRVGHTLSTLTKGASSTGSSGSGGFNRTPNSELPSNSVSRIFEKLGQRFKDVEWSPQPEVLKGQQGGVRPTDFDAETVDLFLRRNFGFTEISQIPRDMHRTQVQKMLMQKRQTNEPVIVLQTTQGFKLLEGWHRTMNYLLKGAPPQHLEILRTGKSQGVDLTHWKPVPIMAFVGRGPEIRSALAGTGDWQHPVHHALN